MIDVRTFYQVNLGMPYAGSELLPYQQQIHAALDDPQITSITVTPMRSRRSSSTIPTVTPRIRVEVVGLPRR